MSREPALWSLYPFLAAFHLPAQPGWGQAFSLPAGLPTGPGRLPPPVGHRESSSVSRGKIEVAMATVRLVKEFYFRDLQALRDEIKIARSQGTKHLTIDLFVGTQLAVQLTMQLSNLYIIKFKGRDRVYDISKLCGENYNHLGMPPTMGTADLQKLTQLSQFQHGVKLDTKLITFAAIVVAEAARFMGVSMHVQGLLSGAFTSISLATLNKKYFTMWSAHSDRVRSGVFTPGEQLQVDVLL